MSKFSCLLSLIFVFNSLALSETSWIANTAFGDNGVFIPQRYPDCNLGYCGNIPNAVSGGSSTDIHSSIVNGNLVAWVSNGTTFRIEERYPGTTIAAARLVLSTSSNTLPQVGRYYESDVAGNTSSIIMLYQRANLNSSTSTLAQLSSCASTTRKGLAYIIESIGYTGNQISSLKVRYSVNCIAGSPNGVMLNQNENSGTITLNITENVNEILLKDLYNARVSLLDSRLRLNKAAQIATDWFLRFSDIRY